MLDWILPEWPAPAYVKAVTTTRKGGVSFPPFDSLNLGLYAGDDPNHVTQNRQFLKKTLALPHDPIWLKQMHGSNVVSTEQSETEPLADAIYSRTPYKICSVLTADCLPVLICSQRHYCVAAIHAGWKGLAAGIIENCIKHMDCPRQNLLAWLGPAIGPDAFFVGDDLVKLFTEQDPKTKTAFQAIKINCWLANIYLLAKYRLNSLGINAVYGGNDCTYIDKARFFSFRRDKITGRMASLIWISP
jgi:polyphenol oxidase